MSEGRGIAFLFDCWDTLICYKERTPSWNVESIRRHTLNKEEVDFEAVEKYISDFFDEYFRSGTIYEISVEQLIRQVQVMFSINLDCDLTSCGKENLDFLAPCPVEGIEDFLSFLDSQRIPYGILSNTIYNDDKTYEIVKRLIPSGNFKFFLGSASVGAKKPGARFFNLGLRLLGTERENTIYVGDSFYADVQGANNASFRNGIWLNWKKKDVEPYKTYIQNFDSLKYVEVDSYKMLENLVRGGRI